MWLLENPPINKTGKDKVQFTFQPGDFVIYYVNKKAEDDYTPEQLGKYYIKHIRNNMLFYLADISYILFIYIK